MAAERDGVTAGISEMGVPMDRARTLLDRYGMRAVAVAAHCASEPNQRLQRLLHYNGAEIGLICLHDCAE